MYGSICQCITSWRWFISDVWEHMSVCSQLDVVHIRCMEAYVSVQLVGGGSSYQMCGSICQCVASWRWFISDVWKHTSVCSQLEVVLHIRCVGAYVSVQLVGGGSYQMYGSIRQCVASWRWFFISDVWEYMSVCSQLEVVHIRCMGAYVSVQLVGGGSYQMHGSISQGQNLQFPKVFNVCRLQVYIEFTENVTLQVSRCVNYTVHQGSESTKLYTVWQQ